MATENDYRSGGDDGSESDVKRTTAQNSTSFKKLKTTINDLEEDQGSMDEDQEKKVVEDRQAAPDQVIIEVGEAAERNSIESNVFFSGKDRERNGLCGSNKVHGVIRLLSGLFAMIIIVITLVIKLASALVSSIGKKVEDEYMLFLYVASVAWIAGSLVFGTYCKKEMLMWSKSNKSSNRWIKGLIALFGMAIMLKDGLLFLSTFHIETETCEEGSRVKAAMYFFHGFFVLAQVIYLFRYAKVYITHCSGGTRMGLMFIIGTNLSNWLAAIVDETIIALESTKTEDHKSSCWCNDSFCEATHVAEKFLFPFMIEFSLVASILLFITWNRAGKKPPPAEAVVKPSYKFYNSYIGASLGGVAMITTVIVIVIMGTPTVAEADDDTSNYVHYIKYLLTHNGFQIGIEMLMIGACVLGLYYFNIIVRPLEDPLPLDVVLLVICILGPFTLNIFTLLAVFAGGEEVRAVEGWTMTFVSPLIDIAQCMLQLGFIVFGLEREPVTNHHHHKRREMQLVQRKRYSSWVTSRETAASSKANKKTSSENDDVDSDYCASMTYENRCYSPSRNPSAESNYAGSSTRIADTNIDSVANSSRPTELPRAADPDRKVVVNDQRKRLSRRIFKRIRHVSTSKMEAIARCRKRSGSVDQSSTVSEATVARPDMLRLRLRDTIMFLILSNVCLWIFQSLEGTAFSLHTYQLEFFGKSAWTTILMICRPLSIFFRMHSAGCLFEVWSYA